MIRFGTVSARPTRRLSRVGTVGGRLGMLVLGMLAALTVVAGGGGGALAQQGLRSEQTCSVYYHSDYRGAALTFQSGEHAPWYGSRWNDQISSVRVSSGCRLEVFEHVTFEGLSAVISQDTAFLGPVWNERVSSSICRCEAPAATAPRDRLFGRDGRDAPTPARDGAACLLFADPSFDGPWRAFRETQEERELGRRLSANVSSVRVAQGCVAVIDIGEPFKLFVDQDVARFPAGVDDRATGVDCFCR